MRRESSYPHQMWEPRYAMRESKRVCIYLRLTWALPGETELNKKRLLVSVSVESQKEEALLHSDGRQGVSGGYREDISKWKLTPH